MEKRHLWFALLLLFALVGCQKVPAGNVGVKVYLLGSSKGVDVEELGPGRYWVGVNEEIYLFPTFTQTYTWTQEQNEQIGFQTVEGLGVNADVGITYRIEPDKATEVFQKYRKGVEEITDLYLRNMVRDALVKSASRMPVESVYGAGKAKLIAEVLDEVVSQTKPLGITVEKIYWIGEIRIPEIVQTAIGNKIKATQVAQQRENEIAQAKAEAEIKITQARGEAESALIRARADAESIEVRGSALRENSALIEMTKAERWNGVLPQFQGSALPFLQLPVK